MKAELNHNSCVQALKLIGEAFSPQLKLSPVAKVAAKGSLVIQNNYASHFSKSSARYISLHQPQRVKEIACIRANYLNLFLFVDLSRLFVPFNIFSSCIKQHSETLNNINQIIDYVNINYCNLCARKIQVCTHAHESRVDQSKHLTHRWIQFKKASVKRFCVLLALLLMTLVISRSGQIVTYNVSIKLHPINLASYQQLALLA